MPFFARQPDTCSRCHTPIHIGQEIRWSKRDSSAGRWHAACDARLTYSVPAIPATSPVPVTSQESVNVTPIAPASDLAALMAAAIQPHITAQVGDLDARIESAMNARVDAIMEVIKAHTSQQQTVTHEHVITSSRGTVTLSGQQHANFGQLLQLIGLKLPVYLWGEPGSGKSTAAIMAAKALGMSHAYISLSAQTTESRLMGYMDAKGEYVETDFYRCYRDGGVFVIDEMDNASANLLTALNSALENGKAAFPCGQVDRHEDFVIVATGNTNAMNPNRAFPDRRPLDGAFRERFVFLRWDTDISLERNLALSMNPRAGDWIDWIQAIRLWVNANFPTLLVTQRASIRGAKLLAAGLPIDQVAELCLFKGFSPDSISRLLDRHPLPHYTAAPIVPVSSPVLASNTIEGTVN